MFQGLFNLFVGDDGGGDDGTGGETEAPSLPPESAVSEWTTKPSAKQLKVTEGHAGRRIGAGVAKQAHDSPARSPFRKSRDSNKSRGSTSSLLSSHLPTLAISARTSRRPSYLVPVKACTNVTRRPSMLSVRPQM